MLTYVFQAYTNGIGSIPLCKLYNLGLSLRHCTTNSYNEQGIIFADIMIILPYLVMVETFGLDGIIMSKITI